MPKPVSPAEAELIGKKVLRSVAARAELATAPRRFPRVLIWLAPSLLLLPFGESLARAWGVNSQLVYILLLLCSAVLAALWEIAQLQRRVKALGDLLQERESGSV